jgi:hypothetical protein
VSPPQYARPIDEKSRRNANDEKLGEHAFIRIAPNRIRHLKFRQELSDVFVRTTVVDANADELETARFVRRMNRTELRNLRSARMTPCCPDVQQHHFAAHAGKRY